MDTKEQRRAATRACRAPMQSPGRPPVWRREHLCLFGDAIAQGVTSEDAAIVAGVSPAVGTRWFRDNGGMSPLSTGSRSNGYLAFTEREEIAILFAQDVTVRDIARRLGRSPLTISRELRRNVATRGGDYSYRAKAAQWHADRRAKRSKVAKLASKDALRHYVQERLAGTLTSPDGEAVRGPRARWNGRRHGIRQDRRWANAWSAEQISKRLSIDFPGDESMRISHEAIYQALYIQGRGALRRELVACLRTGRALRVRRARAATRAKTFVGPEIMISERPSEADDRSIPGHWEGDLIIGLDSSAIATLVERSTRFTMLIRLPRMEGHRDQPRAKNGPALAGHGAEAVRDANEVAAVAAALNGRPRKALGWRTPAEAFNEYLSSLLKSSVVRRL